MKSQDKINKKEIPLKIKDELYENFFNDRHLLIAYLNIRFNFIKVNNAYAKNFGRKPSQFIGKNIFDFFPDKDIKSIFKVVIKTGKPYIGHKKPLVYQNYIKKEASYWDWSIYPIKNMFKKINGYVIILIDITDKVKGEKKLKRVQKDLDDSKRLKDLGTLAATIAHELRNPLGVILAALFNIKSKNKDPSLEKHLNNIEKKIIESDQIINNLLNYSNIKNPILEKVKIYDLIQESLLSVKKRFFKSDVMIEEKLDKIKEAEIKIDPFQIKEVFINILNNSYQAFPLKKGRVIIDGNIRDDFIFISIQDNGKGIDKNDINKIFEPFFTKKTKGTGLGLSICKEMIILHNGTINVKSKKNKGTTITIKLPLI